MYNQSGLGLEVPERRAYVPRHGIPDPTPEPEPLPAPPWAEPSRLLPALVGERPTKVLLYPPPAPGELEAMRLPTRQPQKARWWAVQFGELGQLLDAWKRVFR